MTLLRILLGDLAADRRRSALLVAAIAPIVAAYLILIAVAGGLLTDAVALRDETIVLLSPNALDPASGRLDPAVLDLVTTVGGDSVAAVEPMIFRPIRMGDRILQLRAAPFDSWETAHGLTLLDGHWPGTGDEIAITEGIAIAAGWGVGTETEIFGTTFRVTALVRAPGTKFASVWMRYERADTLFEGATGFQMVTITPTPGTDVRDLKATLDAAAGADFSVYYTTDLINQQGAREGAARSLAAVATLIGVAALAFGGFNLAALTLVERRRDLGIARSLGFSSAAIARFTLARSVLLAAVGFLVGAAAAVVVLANTAATTLRGFVFVPRLTAIAWTAGVTITLVAALVGTILALRSPMRHTVGTLLEAR